MPLRAKISSKGNCDFISKLPDPILCQILGLLNTKKAVQACVLSKRWEHLWTSLPSLNFEFAFEFAEHEALIDMIVASRSLAKFVNTLLLSRKPLDLNVFRLSCKFRSAFSCQVRDWICYAVNHNPRVLHLTLGGSVPCCIYNCKSLKELYLDCPRIDSSIPIVNLPNLRKLSIYNANLNSCYVKNLLSGCTKLEFLLLDTCFFSECIISHGCLKNLTILYCEIKETGLFIGAPNLLSFTYIGELSKITLNMPSLRSVSLASCEFSTNTFIEGMATFFSFLTNVELMALNLGCGWDQEFLSAELPLELPIFPKLKHVTVVFYMYSSFQILSWILKSSLNLKKLTILQQEDCLSDDEEEARTNMLTNASSTIAISPCKKLEIVVVKYWKYNKMMQQLVDSLMGSANELENLEIDLSKNKSSM